MKHRTIPAWVIVVAGAVVTGVAILWASGLHDESGNDLLDLPTATVLVALLGATVTLLTLILQRTSQVKHELRPNSGGSARDSMDRTEVASKSTKTTVERLVQQVGHLERAHRSDASERAALREDVQAVRRDLGGTAADVRGLRADIGRLTDLITKERAS